MKTFTFEALLVCGLAAATTGCAQTPPPSSTTHSQPAPKESAAAPVAAPDATTTLTHVPGIVHLSPALQEVLRMLRAGVEPSVLLTHIRQSAQPFAIGTEEVLYLTDLGASGEVINAMMDRDQQLASAEAAAPPASALTHEAAGAPVPVGGAGEADLPGPPAESVTVEYFQDYLAPYGAWVDISGYGRCWQPTAGVTAPGWMPYGDGGRWLYTDYGWYWYSDYTWGWAAFHYGRWLHHSTYGWCWAPGTVWGPSWVTWRYTDDYAGWAPLPPASSFSLAVGIGWSVPYYCYTYVPVHQVCHPRPRHCAVPHARSEHIHKQARSVTRYSVARDHTIVNQGIDPDQLDGTARGQLSRARVLHGDDTARPTQRRETFDPQQAVVRTFGSRTTTGRTSTRTAETQRTVGQERPTRQIPTVTRSAAPESRENALVMRGTSPEGAKPSTPSPARERSELRERGSFFSATSPRESLPPERPTREAPPAPTSVRSSRDTSSSAPVVASPNGTATGNRPTEVERPTVPRVSGSVTTRVPVRPEGTPGTLSRETTRQRTMSATPDTSRPSVSPPASSRSMATRSSTTWPSVRPSTPVESSREASRFTAPSRTMPTAPPSRSVPTRSALAPTPQPSAPSPAPTRSFAAPPPPSREVSRVTTPAAPTRQIPSAAPASPAPPSQGTPAPAPTRGAPRGGRERG